MAKTQTVTISLEEYKELLLKDRPTDKDHEMVERILNEIQKHLEYADSKWDSYYIGDNMKVEHPSDIIEEIMLMLKYVDFDRYMKMWNAIQTAERNRKAMAEMSDQMSRAKELRQENTNE